MKKVRSILIKTDGTNCDDELMRGFVHVGAESDIVHINRLKADPEILKRYQIIGLPGGFTYGDYVSAGTILANELTTYLGDEIHRFIEDGKLMIGICNGFQVLVKAGLLPWPSEAKQTVTLWRNDSGKFEDRWVYLKNESSRCIWTKGIDRIYVPVAHAEGKFMADEPVLDRIRREDLVVFKYVDERGEPAKGVYPISPNGSVDDIAGICDPTGRIFGLMPHPERNTLKHRDPRIRRKYHSLRAQEREGEGAAVLRNGVDYARQLI